MTNGRYELRESLIQELKTGTFNWNYASFFPPILPTLTDVRLEMRDSKLDPLIRAADIVANRVYFKARTNDLPDARRKVSVLMLP